MNVALWFGSLPISSLPLPLSRSPAASLVGSHLPPSFVLTCAHFSPMIPLTPTLHVQVLSKPSFDAAAERAWQVLLDVGFVRACRHHWLPVRQWRWRVAPSAATTNPSSAVHMKCVRRACSALGKNCIDSSYKLGYTKRDSD